MNKRDMLIKWEELGLTLNENDLYYWITFLSLLTSDPLYKENQEANQERQGRAC